MNQELETRLRKESDLLKKIEGERHLAGSPTMMTTGWTWFMTKKEPKAWGTADGCRSATDVQHYKQCGTSHLRCSVKVSPKEKRGDFLVRRKQGESMVRKIPKIKEGT